MPDFVSKIATRPVFGDADPFMFEYPGLGKWRLNDYGVRPPHESKVSPTTAPVSYLIETIANTAHTPADAESIREAFTSAYESGVVGLSALNEISEEIAKIYAKAAETTVSQATGLPTTGH